MSEVTELLEQQGEAINSFAAQQKTRFDTVEAQLKAERREREALEAKINRGALGGGFREDDQTKVLAEGRSLMAMLARRETLPEAFKSELKTMSVDIDPQGGYVVQSEVSPGWTKKIFDGTPMRRLAKVITMTAGDAYEEPLDNNDPQADWVSEGGARTAGTTPAIGKIVIPLYEISALQPMTQKLLDEANRDLGAWLEGKIADKFVRTEGTAFVSGSGVGRPRGFLSYTTTSTGDATRSWGQIQYVATGAATDFATGNPADVLLQTVYTLRAPYRAGARWLMNSTTARKVSQFKDGMGNYLWQGALSAGTPNLLCGFPVEISEDMADTGANTYPIAFANWPLAYYIIDLLGMRMFRDQYTSKPNILFYAIKRVGGGLANSEAIKLIKCAVS